jgi:hypothetical protein
MTANWYETHEELVAFGRVLADALDFDTNDVLDYFEKPWKWSSEYQAWMGWGCPTREDSGWELFTKALEKVS